MPAASGHTGGQLLVASPAISDGIFDRSVVCMLHHDDFGAIGVIINDPSGLAIDELLPRWADLTVKPSVVFDGGPVEPNGFIGVGLALPGADDDESFTRLPDSGLVTVDLDADPAIVAASVSQLRIFRGYAGWSAGQLDGEIAAGGWFIVDADEDVWSAHPDDLFEAVLRRQRGDLRWFANAPADPSLN